MARHQIVIETRETEERWFEAAVAQGPAFALNVPPYSIPLVRESAYRCMQDRIRKRFPKHSFDFLHAEH